MGVLLGIFITVNLSAIVAGIEGILGFKFLAPDVYFISDFPSRIDSGDVIEVALIGVFLSFVSTMIPAWKAAAMAPAEALRHE
jgi:lipoprotein-releasing system permease protein